MSTSQVLRYVLAAEFALGGQARLTAALTSSINKFVLSKSDSFFQNLSFLPGRNAAQKTQLLGALMCVTAGLFAVPRRKVSPWLRLGTTLLSGSLSTVLLIGEATIKGDVWLPAVNIALAGWLLYDELRV